LTCFVDTGILVAFHNRRDVNHERAREIIQEILEGQHGVAYTSDYIFDEAVTVAQFRTKDLRIAKSVGELILGEETHPFLNIRRVTERGFIESWDLFKNLSDKELSFTDCTSITLIRDLGIEKIISFDSNFDGIISRIF